MTITAEWPTSASVEADNQLLAAFVATRDDAAFRALVARYGPMVLAVAKRQVASAHGAEDVAQATFLVLVRRAASIKPDQSLGAWLHRTTLLTARNARRADDRRRRRERKVIMQNTRTLHAAATANTQTDNAMLTALDRALDGLGRPDREVLALRYFDDLRMEDVAARLRVAPDAARKRLYRAIVRLRHAVTGESLKSPDTNNDWATTAMSALAGPLPDSVHQTAHLVNTLATPSASARLLAKGTLRMITCTALVKTALFALGATALLGGTVTLALFEAAPDAPTTVATTKPAALKSPIEQAWDDLAKGDPEASSALLTFAATPAESVAFFKPRLTRLVLTPEALAADLTALESNDEAVWRPAFERLQWLDPRLAVSLQRVFDATPDPVARPRLVALLSGYEPETFTGKEIVLRGGENGEGNNNFYIEDHGSWWAEADVARINQSYNMSTNKSWTRAVRAMVLLKRIGTPEAIAILTEMAAGHPDAQPTRVAKSLLEAQPSS